MKKEDWLQAMQLADEKYVEEADPSKRVNVQKKRRHRWGILAACLCSIFFICSLVLFLPFNMSPPDVSQYEDSEYYSIIQKVNALTYEKPKYKNNFEKLADGFSRLFFGTLETEEAIPPSVDPDMGGKYQEITDNQVDGVIEGDRIKRSDRYIYFLDEAVIKIFSIEQEDSKLVGSFDLRRVVRNGKFYDSEFYLSADCKTITLIASEYNGEAYVHVISLDVSEPANIKMKKKVSITGGYISSRMTNGNLLLLTQFGIIKEDLDFEKEETFLPQIDQGNGMECISADGIIAPETLTDSRYTVVLKLDEDTLAMEGSAAYLSYSKEVYVSAENVFATHSYFEQTTTEGGLSVGKMMTEIACLSYTGDTFEHKGSFTVEGKIENQYSLDEYKGILRVVTTTTTITLSGKQNANLYCIDLKDMQVVSEVIAFAPEGERVQSVRFDRDNAYVCTSIHFTDPVFFFDLSDIHNITYKDTGTIEGFSTSLVDFGNGYLLGIGRGDAWGSFKIEIYEETTDGVRSVCKYEMEYTDYSTEYKAYYIDRENQLIGMGINREDFYPGQEPQRDRYLLLLFDGYALQELINTPLNGYSEYQRAVYIDDYLYMFGRGDFVVKKVF